MTAATAENSSIRLGRGAPGRAGAFAAARRHTAFVRWLKRLIVLVIAGGTAALILSAIFDLFRVLPAAVSVSDVSLSGTRITMELPKLSGFRNDGKPYQVTAKSAAQDIRTPGIVDLSELLADVGMADSSRAHVTARNGRYDSSKELLNLNTDVELKADKGYDLKTENVDIDFHAGSLVADKPVSVLMNNGSINASRMVISDNGKRLMFEGNVRSVLLPAATAAEEAQKLKGTEP
jgi:lipopolysaccharide export system protein LptC